jgi:hypothetical protein
MPASVALVGLDPDMHELLHSLLTDEGYAVARDGAADVALVEAGWGSPRGRWWSAWRLPWCC